MNHIARIAVAMTLAAAVPAASVAEEFFAVVEATGRRSHAYLDVAVDTRSGVGVNVDFRVYDFQGTQLGEFFVPIDARGFASTESFGNLFDLSGGQPMLIRAVTAQNSVLSGATLGVVPSRGPSLILGVMPEKKLDGSLSAPGKLFSTAVGSFRSAWLLIGNVSGAQTSVDVYRGTEDIPGRGIYYNPQIPNYGQWRVNLTQNDALSNLVIRADGVVIVQMVIDDGKSLHAYMVAPMY